MANKNYPAAVAQKGRQTYFSDSYITKIINESRHELRFQLQTKERLLCWMNSTILTQLISELTYDFASVVQTADVGIQIQLIESATLNLSPL